MLYSSILAALEARSTSNAALDEAMIFIKAAGSHFHDQVLRARADESTSPTRVVFWLSLVDDPKKVDPAASEILQASRRSSGEELRAIFARILETRFALRASETMQRILSCWSKFSEITAVAADLEHALVTTSGLVSSRELVALEFHRQRAQLWRHAWTLAHELLNLTTATDADPLLARALTIQSEMIVAFAARVPLPDVQASVHSLMALLLGASRRGLVVALAPAEAKSLMSGIRQARLVLGHRVHDELVN